MVDNQRFKHMVNCVHCTGLVLAKVNKAQCSCSILGLTVCSPVAALLTQLLLHFNSTPYTPPPPPPPPPQSPQLLHHSHHPRSPPLILPTPTTTNKPQRPPHQPLRSQLQRQTWTLFQGKVKTGLKITPQSDRSPCPPPPPPPDPRILVPILLNG